MSDTPRSIVLIGRRWFQRLYGNTYHSVEVYVNGKLAHRVPFEYGYGNQWEQTGTEWLDGAGFLPGLEQYSWGGSESLQAYCQRQGIELVRSVTDVGRRKDL